MKSWRCPICRSVYDAPTAPKCCGMLCIRKWDDIAVHYHPTKGSQR